MLKIQEIRELIKLIDESSIDEFTYEANGTSITMKKKATQPIETKQVVTQPVVTAPAMNNEKSAIEQEQTVEVAKQSETAPSPAYDYEIVSPMVGTFYQAPSPESDPYVSVGSQVSEDTVVCIVEAMKLFNEIEAEISGEIVEILVEDGELVEYDQPLFRVKKQ